MKRLDLTVVFGLAIGLLAVGGSAALEGINPTFLWQPTAALVVIGGTTGAVIVRRGIGGLRAALRATIALFTKDTDDEVKVTLARLAWLAREARHGGTKVFENHAGTTRDPLVQRALTLASEFAVPEAVRSTLDRILDYEDEQGLHNAATLEAAGGYAPTFGILGAVLGLIQVLRVINDPGALGAGIATAFVATIYGVGIANLLLFPLGARLRERHQSHMRRREGLADALVALAAHESPAVITSHYHAAASDMLSASASAHARRMQTIAR